MFCQLSGAKWCWSVCKRQRAWGDDVVTATWERAMMSSCHQEFCSWKYLVCIFKSSPNHVCLSSFHEFRFKRGEKVVGSEINRWWWWCVCSQRNEFVSFTWIAELNTRYFFLWTRFLSGIKSSGTTHLALLESCRFSAEGFAFCV